MLRLEALYYYSLISARATTNFQNAAVPATAGRFGVRELALALVAPREREWVIRRSIPAVAGLFRRLLKLSSRIFRAPSKLGIRLVAAPPRCSTNLAVADSIRFAPKRLWRASPNLYGNSATSRLGRRAWGG